MKRLLLKHNWRNLREFCSSGVLSKTSSLFFLASFFWDNTYVIHLCAVFPRLCFRKLCHLFHFAKMSSLNPSRKGMNNFSLLVTIYLYIYIYIYFIGMYPCALILTVSNFMCLPKFELETPKSLTKPTLTTRLALVA